MVVCDDNGDRWLWVVMIIVTGGFGCDDDIDRSDVGGCGSDNRDFTIDDATSTTDEI